MVRQRLLNKLATVTWKEYVKMHNSQPRGERFTLTALEQFSKKKRIDFHCQKQKMTLKGQSIAGRTNGKEICLWISGNIHYDYYTFFHEYGHYKLHFKRNRVSLSREKREVEADVFSFMICDQLFPGNSEAFKNMVEDNPLTSIKLNIKERELEIIRIRKDSLPKQQLQLAF